MALDSPTRKIDLDGKCGVRARRLYTTAIPFGIAGACVLAYYKIDGVILFHLKGAGQAGYYSAAYKFLDVLQNYTVNSCVCWLTNLQYSNGRALRYR